MHATALSLGEAGALAVKAMRGAGASWGLAEEAGWAVRWLGARNAPGLETLARLLEAWPGEEISGNPEQGFRASGPLCPIRAGCVLADFAPLSATPLRFERVAWPLLMVPFAARVGWGLSPAPEGLERADIEAKPGAFTFHQPVGDRVQISGAALARLHALAHRTYVPASAASRQGAGAGTRDND
ncbi:MAG: DUF3726 domain-containing protein [Pseudomonadota bacterium]